MLKKFILVLNCGSSSLKFALFDLNNWEKYLSGIAEYFNSDKAKIKWKLKNLNFSICLGKKSSHIQALNMMMDIILKNKIEKNIIAVGHRIVHGGIFFKKSILINSEVIKNIKKATIFAPLHNPAHLICINYIMEKLPYLKNKNVAVFDTAFHHTMMYDAYLYGVPYSWYKKYGIRRYGAHGISHLYSMQKSSKFLKKNINKLNIITCHLGNGSSITAIRNGISIENSMGMTPLEGLVMGTRSGDIDPTIIFFLYKNFGMNIDKIFKILNEKSGLLGLTGVTNDFRYVEENYYKENNAKIAMNVFSHRLTKYISAYSCMMNGRLDALVFTGGIGENSINLRNIIIKKLSLLGLKIDKEKNLHMKLGKSGFINKKNTIPILIIPSNEEIIIAKDTFMLTKK